MRERVAMRDKSQATRAAVEVAQACGAATDRCDVLQDGSTLVLRLSETLVARVVVEIDGPRQGTAWFARENAVVQHLSRHGAPVIPLHPDLPPGPHERHGFPLSFWKFVRVTGGAPDPAEAARALQRCHSALRSFSEPLPELAILEESLGLLDTLTERRLFPEATVDLLRRRLSAATAGLSGFPRQALHGDAHFGNVLMTDEGLLWTDWEDAFSGPVEWDVASLIWNARLLDGDEAAAEAMVRAWEEEGGPLDPEALHHSLVARAAVMSAWYPLLYPDAGPERQDKLRRRLAWLESVER